jgi:hypothetical protein
VEHNLASGKRLLNRCRITQIASHSFGAKVSNVAQIARWPHQKPQVGSMFSQHPRNMTSQKSSSPGNESSHASAISPLL